MKTNQIKILHTGYFNKINETLGCFISLQMQEIKNKRKVLFYVHNSPYFQTFTLSQA